MKSYYKSEMSWINKSYLTMRLVIISSPVLKGYLGVPTILSAS
jgi:hypothetical protein